MMPLRLWSPLIAHLLSARSSACDGCGFLLWNRAFLRRFDDGLNPALKSLQRAREGGGGGPHAVTWTAYVPRNRSLYLRFNLKRGAWWWHADLSLWKATMRSSDRPTQTLAWRLWGGPYEDTEQDQHRDFPRTHSELIHNSPSVERECCPVTTPLYNVFLDGEKMGLE